MNEQRIGLAKNEVRLVEHQPEWSTMFIRERERIAAALDGGFVDIQHVGSTAIPGIAAKPIIDIAVAVDDIRKVGECVAPLESLGYIYRGELGLPDRHFFILGEPRIVNLHLTQLHFREWRRQIAFRDYLRANAAAAAGYDALKKQLAERFPLERERYTEEKSAFILNILNLAGVSD